MSTKFNIAMFPSTNICLRCILLLIICSPFTDGLHLKRNYQSIVRNSRSIMKSLNAPLDEQYPDKLGAKIVNRQINADAPSLESDALERFSLEYQEKENQPVTRSLVASSEINTSEQASLPKASPKKLLLYRWLTGLSLGAICTTWITLCGPAMFALCCIPAALISHKEFFDMVRATGVPVTAYSTTKTATVLFYFIAAMAPRFHELVLPLSGIALIAGLLTNNQQSPTIAQVSTGVLGIFYAGYLPSFLVRLQSLGARGTHLLWWSCFAVACSDIGAYFVGKNFGRHKLSVLNSAAGAASPNKTVEGFFGGMGSSVFIASLGAFILKWPHWKISGPLYGMILAVVGLIGDLAASMFKRDAKMKDSGTILPGHGGILDRIDSYIFTAPLMFFICKYFLM